MSFTPEDLRRLRETVRLRGEEIERRTREIDVLRRAAWLRMDLLREDGVLDPPGVAAAPRATVADPRQAQGVVLSPATLAHGECPRAQAGGLGAAAPAITETVVRDAALARATHRELAPAL